MKKKRLSIITDTIPPLLIKLTLPSIVGMLGIMIFNIVDTYFIGQLGITELAAISFTFPVVIVIGSFTLGLGTGVMALFSRAVGSHDVEEEQRLATSSLILGILLSFIIGIVGWFTIEPLFSLLGADATLMPYIVTYMRIWYLGICFIVVPMIGDHVLRGLGDTVTPSFVMLTCAIVNAVLDPILIFGLGHFPKMGIAGAAIATVFARLITMVVSLYLQIFRDHLISLKALSYRIMLEKWKKVVFLGIPNAAVKMIMPIGIGVFTAILARYGNETVAGYGVAAKIEGFVMATCYAMAITAAVFVGQNLGAHKMERVAEGIWWLKIYSILYGVLTFVVLALTGRYVGAFFNANPVVQKTVFLYLIIVPASYGFYAIIQIGTSVLNALHKPLHAGILSVVQILIINIPLALLFSSLWGTIGVFSSIGLTYILAGIITLYLMDIQIKKYVLI